MNICLVLDTKLLINLSSYTLAITIMRLLKTKDFGINKNRSPRSKRKPGMVLQRLLRAVAVVVGELVAGSDVVRRQQHEPRPVHPQRLRQQVAVAGVVHQTPQAT